MLTNVTELATELFQKKGVCYYLTRLIAFKNTSNQVWSEQPKELPLVSGLPNTRISLIKNSSLLRGYCSHDKGHFFIIHFLKINSLAPSPQNGQTHSNNSSAKGGELFECVWPFCGVGA